jgi:molecular chaperone GrpE
MNKFDETDNKTTSQPETTNQEQATSPLQEPKESFLYKEQFMRVSADFANYKKRIEKERLDWMQSAERLIIQKMLPIIDDLDRALALAQGQAAQEQQAWLEGFVLIQKNVRKIFEDLGVQEIVATGVFDPELHEALMNVPNSGKEPGAIVDVLRKGYMLKDRVIRHAQVSVAQ